jgi:mono/diheme cytochrome c family protein
MKINLAAHPFFVAAVIALCIGCNNAPGKPKPSSEAMRPEQVMDFATLYKQNCAACHGEHGQQGAAVSLANPVYLAFAGKDNLQRVTANGLPGTLMPGFSKTKGGTLTVEQISVLANGMVDNWGGSGAASGQQLPAYAGSTPGDVTVGQKAFLANCSHCHGTDGTGVRQGEHPTGSLVDPTYLALVSDQGLRSTIVAGRPADGMPSWRSESSGGNAHTMNDQEITDMVAWFASQRSTTPGQPYKQYP